MFGELDFYLYFCSMKKITQMIMEIIGNDGGFAGRSSCIT